jgi:outer membrane lipoprotein SlyB
MEATARKGLHPLLTAAAVSLIVFSAVGVAALTGVLPKSSGSSKEAAPALVSAPDVAAAVAARSALEKPADEVPAMPPAPAVSTPKPAKKRVVQARPQPAPAVPAQDFGEAPRVAQAPVPAAPAVAPKPGLPGVVESVREVKTPAAQGNGGGAVAGGVAGGVAGAVIGNQMGKGTTRTVLTLLGVAGGALAGNEIEKQAKSTKHWEITVRLDDGSVRTLNSSVQPFWHGGERVRLLDGSRLEPA